jgi:hypothetical protein
LTSFTTALAIVTAYHLLTSLIGLVAAYMGFRLFRYGVFERAGELKLAWGDRSLLLKQAAPGTFFSVLGAGIIAVSLVTGVKATLTPVASDTNVATSQASSGMVISGLGGASGLTPLSVVLRHALSDFALCILAAADEAGRESCHDHMVTVDLNNVPSSEDLRDIEDLEAKPAAQRDAASQAALVSLRNRFLKPSQR